MLRKKEVFTIITPIPGFIPRQLAIDILHSHSEVITLNPLVLEHKPIKAPRNAASDEYYSTWYEITERIQYIPGIGKMGSGKISFNGCFHDMPWGLQTHIYAPMNVNLKNRYRIAGNQPGVEPPEQLEIGLAQLGAPSDGLYLRDDVEIKCNVAVVGFVKSQLKNASREMVSRIIKKAELLDAGVLQGMIENGRLRTVNPNDRSSNTMSPDGSRSPPRPQYSPTFMDRSGAMSPEGGGPTPYQIPRPMSYQTGYNNNRPGGQNNNNNNAHWSAPYGGIRHSPSSAGKGALLPVHAELPDQGRGGGQMIMPIEMPGDYSFPQSAPPHHLAPPQPSPTYPSDHDSTVSGHSSRISPQLNAIGGGGGGGGGRGGGGNDWRWSQSQHGSNLSRPTSIQSDVSGGGGGGGAMHSPGLPTEHLPTHEEMPEQEHNVNPDALRKLDPVAARRAQYLASTPPPQRSYAYNPADYAKMGRGSPMRSHSYGYAGNQ